MQVLRGVLLLLACVLFLHSSAARAGQEKCPEAASQWLDRYGYDLAPAQLARLESLSLTIYGQMDRFGMPYLSALKNLPILKDQVAVFQEEDLHSLQCLPELRSLSLNVPPLGPKGIGLLNRLPNLEELSLTMRKTGDHDLRWLSALQPSLTLKLEGGPTSDAGMQYLTDIPDLEGLYLSNSRITDKGLAHLDRLPNLHSLDISFTRVTDEGLHHLGRMGKITELYIGGDSISPGLLEMLQQAKSGMFIYIYRSQESVRNSPHY